jgi:hypothetical protein
MSANRITNPSNSNEDSLRELDALLRGQKSHDSAPTAENCAAIPVVLKQHPNWVGWKFITKDGKPTKVPFNVQTGTPAKANDPSTWTTFEQVLAATEFPNDHTYAGIGFELGGTSIVGIDFDNAITDGKGIDPFVFEILKLLGNPYTELSPSGKGLHTFVECDVLPEGGRKLSQGHTGIEIYHGREAGRYFTMTGQRVFGDSIPKIDDISLPYFLITQNKDKMFKSLWMGDTATVDGGDDSSADWALVNTLVEKFSRDPQKIETAFSASKLGQRDKWVERKDYRDRTIKAAIEAVRTGKSASENEVREIVSGTADQITPKKIVWLWQNRIAQKLNMLVGNPDVGKGLITHYIVACITTGRNWFDAKNTLPPSEALVLSGEEDWDDIIVPRLMAAKADRSKVRWLKMSATKDGKTTEKELQLDRDAAALETFLEDHPNVRLVVVDPISNYLGSAKMIDEQKVREVLTPLKEIANRRRVAIVCVMHLNKKVELDAIHRIGGAMAFVGVARMVWLCAPKPAEDGTESDELLMVKIKGNIVHRQLKGLSYTTKVNYVPIEGDDVAIPYVEWVGEVDQNANELIGKPPKPAHRPAEQLPACVDWLRHYLKDGAKLLVDDVESDGKAIHGFSRATIERARKTAEIVTFESGKTKARDGKMRKQFSCRLNNRDTMQHAEENQASF